MNNDGPTTLLRGLALVLAGGLVLLSCGDDDSSDGDTSSGEQTVEEAESSSDDSGEDADGSAGDVSPGSGNLLVPLDYLQGVWCDSDGTTWTIDGETAQLDDEAGGTGQLPVGVLFVDVPGGLVSQSDDEFVFDSRGEEVTFTRGPC